MNDELLVLQQRVNGLIYNPFINLKDQLKEIKKLLSDEEKYSAELLKISTALNALEAFELLPYGNLERIKGFNKIKSNTLRLIKELLTL